jgi:cytochrome o ubiquinol oxidase subunit I
MFGRLSQTAFQHDAVEWFGIGVMILSGVLVFGLLTYYKRWGWLWREWLTTVDPKRIGVMYLVVAIAMLLKGLVDAMMMRMQQAVAVGDSFGFLGADHFQQVFTAHGSTMIFFVGMGIVFGSMNLLIPLQIGARDVAFPFLNALSFWLFATGAMLLNLSLVVGNFSGAGWLGYPPLVSPEFNPGVGVDYWIWTLQIAGLGSLLSGINFLTTIFTMRCPGMKLMKMPMFVHACVGTLILVVFAFPILTAGLGMLTVDRLFGAHFFSASFGGNQMMLVNLLWAWGHPEVYILILPVFGIFSEVVSTFSYKRLFGYTSMVGALVAITFLSFIVWLHHFFTMGAGPNVNAFFGVMTMLIAIPTGVKVFNWLFTQYRGRVVYNSSMLWFLGFVIAFTIGGAAGVLMSIPPVDFQVHNSLFLIAHFHSMILPGVVFGFFAGFTYWFPKVMGFKLNEPLGRYACYCWIVGFLVAFMPLYLLGFMGATRRLNHYDAATGWQPWFIVAAAGVVILFIGVSLQILQVMVSIRDREKNRDTTGDPWNGRTLEWSTSSPPPFYNFAFVPVVETRDPFWVSKERGLPAPKRDYQAIHMPINTPIPLLIGGAAFTFAFGTIWHILPLAILGLVGVIALVIIRLSGPDRAVLIPAERIAEIEAARVRA